MNKGVECPPLKGIRDYIGIQKERLHRDGIRKVLVHEDLNADSMTIAGFRELTHQDMFHRHQIGGTKKYMMYRRFDTVFVSFEEVGIEEVYPHM